jgi:hypothetical protein
MIDAAIYDRLMIELRLGYLPDARTRARHLWNSWTPL